MWVNNCIGAFNAKYFVLYLLTLTAMAAAIAAITAAFLVRLVLLSDMMHGRYIDDQGQERTVEILFLVQVSLCCLGYWLVKRFLSVFAFRNLGKSTCSQRQDVDRLPVFYQLYMAN